MTYDVAVIGGGCAGMSAAIALARFGRRVLLIEKDTRLAPVLRGFERQGVHFDTGFHYAGGLGRGQILDTLFRFLGLARHVKPFAFRAEGYELCRLQTLGRDVAVPYGSELLQGRLQEAFPGQQQSVARHLDAVRRVFSRSPFLNLQRPAASDDLLSFGDGPTLLDHLTALTTDEVLQTVLALPCLLYGVAPAEAAFNTHALVAGSYLSSVHGLEGGGKALAAAFARQLAAAGVDVVCGHAVTAIALEDRAVSGVVLADGRRYRARCCLYTGHPTLLAELLAPGSLRPSFARRLAGYPETPPAFMAFGVLPAPVPLLDRRNVFLTEATSPRDLLVPGDRTLYLAGGETLPDGRQAFTVMGAASWSDFMPWRGSVTGRRPAAYTLCKERLVASLLERLRSACPELEGLRIVEAATPLTMRDWAASPRGSLYGLRHTAEQFPLLPMTRIKGLLLAGQSVLLPGILGAMVSAMVACSLLVGLEPLRKELRQCSDSASS